MKTGTGIGWGRLGLLGAALWALGTTALYAQGTKPATLAEADKLFEEKSYAGAVADLKSGATGVARDGRPYAQW